MKARLCTLLSVLLAASLLLSGCNARAPSPSPSPTPAAQPINLKFAVHSSPQGPYPESWQWWATELEKRTNGQVKVEIFWGGVLGKATEVIDVVGSGSADLGIVVMPYVPSKLPLVQGVDVVPFKTANGRKMLDAVRTLVKEFPEIEADFLKNNVKPVMFCPILDSTELVSRKPVRSLADLNGMKVRSWGTGTPDVLAAIGAVSAGYAASDVFDPLSKGVIDAAAGSYDLAIRYGWKDVAKYITNIGFGCQLGYALCINKDVWDKLPQNVKDVMLGPLSYDTGEKALELMTAAQKGFVDTLTKDGVEIIDFPKAERAQWMNMDVVKGLTNKWVEESEAKGMPARRFMNRFLELAAD